MLNYFNLIRALNTDQYDDLTVKELKEKFNTEPDIDSSPVVLCHDSLNENGRHGMSIMAHMAKMGIENIILVDSSTQLIAEDKPISDLILKAPDAPMIRVSRILPDVKHSKFQKKKNQYRSRHHKK